MGGPRTSSEAALSGPGRRASGRRDAHTRRGGSLAGTVGTTIPGKDRPSASRSARHSPVPDQFRGHWKPAAKPLGLLRWIRPRVAHPVQASPPKPGSQISAEFTILGTVAASRLDYCCGDPVWSPARAPRRRVLGRTAALHQGIGARDRNAKRSLRGWVRRPGTLGNHHALGPSVTASPPLHQHRRHFGGELPGKGAVKRSLTPHHGGRARPR